jgi:threonine/homoserine/homoserine lactone efflux protein
MTAEQTLAFSLFTVVAAITPGPSNIILTATGATAGVRRGLPCLIGVVLGTGLIMFVVTFGFGSLVLEQPAILRGLKWLGVAVLLWLSSKIATAGRHDAETPVRVVGFWEAAALQWVNPKSWLVSASAAGAYLHAGSDSAFVQAASLGLLFVLIAFPCCALWLVAGASLQRLLLTERASRRFNISMGAILAGSILLFVR